MASISTMLPEQCVVLRDGERKSIEGKDIVPGDVLQINMGNKLPADVRFVQVSSDARFDRAILTGETNPLLASVKSTDDNYLETACMGLAGTHCVSGTALGVVVSTGDRTVFGRVSSNQRNFIDVALTSHTDCETHQRPKTRHDSSAKGDLLLCYHHRFYHGGHGLDCHHCLVSRFLLA